MKKDQLRAVMAYLCDTLGGDWLLSGGSLVRLIFDASRGTEDIDLVRVAHPTLSDEAARDQLYRHLRTLGLGPEHVNPAMEPFVKQVEDWKGELVLIREGKRGRVYRPNLTFFVYLKLLRGTPIDLQDIRLAVTHCGAPEFDETRFQKWATPELRQRLARHRPDLGL